MGLVSLWNGRHCPSWGCGEHAVGIFGPMVLLAMPPELRQSCVSGINIVVYSSRSVGSWYIHLHNHRSTSRSRHSLFLLAIHEVMIGINVKRPIHQLTPHSCKEDLGLFGLPTQDSCK